MILGIIEHPLHMRKILLLILLLIPLTANATVQVKAIQGQPVSVCTPSDPNTNCGGGGGASGNSLVSTITQTTHGFSVGDVVYFNGTIYVKAKTDVVTTSDAVGIVSIVTDANTFTLTLSGYVSGLSGLTAGTVYFLSDTSAGALTATEPVTVNHVSKPLFVANSTTSGYFYNWRGMVIGAVLTNSQPTFTLVSPYYFYTYQSTRLMLWHVPAAWTLTKIDCTGSSNPTTQYNFNIKYANTFIGLASATTMQNVTTTSGAFSKSSSFTSPSVSAGKDMYIEFAAAPDSGQKQLHCTIIGNFT